MQLAGVLAPPSDLEMEGAPCGVYEGGGGGVTAHLTAGQLTGRVTPGVPGERPDPTD